MGAILATIIDRNSEVLLKRLIETIFERNCEIRDKQQRKEIIERWSESIVLMVVDASFTFIGLNYFTAVVPKV
ncbi:MAG: hypothetical protein QXO96_06035 [Sulfolobales archaeon]